MTGAAVTGVLATAGILGVTHAIEPDHVAGISSFTSRYGDARLSALVGACFSLGHVALVVAWLGVGYVLLGRTSFAPAFEIVGTLGVAVLLGLLGAAMTVGGLRSALHVHDHGDGVHAHALPLADHDHGTRRYLRTGVVGALFTLSPPVSMIVFSATLFPAHGPAVVASAVLAYATAITATMSALGAGVGSLFGAIGDRPRLHGAGRAIAGIAVGGLAVSVLLDVLPALG